MDVESGFYRRTIKATPDDFFDFYPPEKCVIRVCHGCRNPTMWYERELVWPEPHLVMPSRFMPDNVRKPFEEAQSIVMRSPSAAAGLIRLSLERLCANEGLSGRLVDMIGKLNLPPHILNAAHACRLIGNDGVHEGFIRYDPDISVELVIGMSELLNAVVDYTIGSKELADGLMAIRDKKS